MRQRTLQKSKGFTLIELMITVTVMGVIFAIALPSYQTYVVQSKVAKGYKSLEHYRTAVMEYVAINGDFSNMPSGWKNTPFVRNTFEIDTSNYIRNSGSEKFYLRGYRSHKNRYYMYNYMYNKNWSRFHPDSPTIITYWVTRPNSSQPFTYKCNYYTHGKGWNHVSGRRFVPSSCR